MHAGYRTISTSELRKWLARESTGKDKKALQLEIIVFIEAALWIICCGERHLHAKAQPLSLLQRLPMVCVHAGHMAEIFSVQSGN